MIGGWKNELVSALLKADSVETQKIKNAHIPSRLYKYCPLNEYSLKNIRDNTLWLSYPEKVNDPYDTSITVDIKRLSNDSFRNGEYWRNLEKQNNSDAFTEEEREYINQAQDCTEALKLLLIKKYPKNKSFIEGFLKEDEDQKHREALERFNNHQKNLIRFCSLSERVDSLLMWSHYAKHHTGICIQYEFNEAPNLLQYLYPVIYDDTFFDWTPNMDDPNKGYLAKIVATIHKAKDWEYEKEWRLLTARENNITTFMAKLPVIKPSGIYLGSRVDFDSEILNNIKREAETQKIAVYNMVLSPAKFKMESQRVF